MLTTRKLSLAATALTLSSVIVFSTKEAQADKSSTPVQVTNPADIAKAEGIQLPFMQQIDCVAGNKAGSNHCNGSFQFASTERVVIEYASSHCVQTDGAQITEMLVGTTVNGATASSEINVLNPSGVSADGQSIVSVGEPVRLYSDAGSTVTVEAQTTRTPGANLPLSCTFVLSGQSVSVP
jgi:hypothetical protein